jgi:hypothetical protein
MKVYFTFGQTHYTKEGYQMKDHWVKVVGKDYDDCKKIFTEQFIKDYMDDERLYGTTYQEESFDPKYFPKGEFMLILEKN